MARPRKDNDNSKPKKVKPFAAWLDAGLSKQGKSNTRLAEILGISQSRVSEMRNGKRDPQAEELKPIAEYLALPLPPGYVASDRRSVPIVGYVGAGAEAHSYGSADNPNEDAPMPPGGTMHTVGVEIRGTSLGSIFDRWIVFYDEVRKPPTPDMYRKLCVVGLADGRVLVKKLLPGTKKGLFHLESQTEGLIEDQTVEWCAVVRAMTPR